MNPEEMQETPQQAIERYTTDFTKLAADGKLDPVIGREDHVSYLGMCLKIYRKKSCCH